MDHSAHVGLMLVAAAAVTASGVIALALAGRRWRRRECSDVVLGMLSGRQTVASFAFVPLAGILGIAALEVISAGIR